MRVAKLNFIPKVFNLRVLISGAGGFCGRHLLAYLRTLDVEIHTLGPTVTSNLHHYADPLDLETLKLAIARAQPDYIFHLAGVVTSPVPATYYQINCAYAAGLLRALELTGYGNSPVLLIGTAAEYGHINQSDLPITEATIPRPYSDYGISKLAQTHLGLALSAIGRPLIMVRPFNIIGTQMPVHVALQSFVQQVAAIIRKQTLPVIEVGNLSSARDFIEVDQVVRILWQLIQLPAAYREIINICSGQATKMSDLVDRLIECSGESIEIRIDPARFKPVDIPIHYGSPARLESLIGYTPGFNLDLTLRQILEAYLKKEGNL